MDKKYLIALAFCFCSTSFAQSISANQNSKNLYFGISFGQSDHKTLRDPVTTFSRFDDRDSMYKLVGGYQINPSVAIELSYVNLGATSQAGITVSNGVLVSVSGDTKAYAYTLATKLSAFSPNSPASRRISITPFIKLGVSQLSNKPNFSGNFFGSPVSISNRAVENTDLYWSIGADYEVMKDLSAVVEYESFGRAGGGSGEPAQIKPTGLSVGVIKRF